MTVLIGAITNTGRLNSRTSVTQSHTLEEGAYNTLIVCVGMCQGSYDVSTITYAGFSLTKATEKGRNDYMGEIWYLNNAPSGSNNVVVTYTGTVTSTVINIFGLIGANTLNAVNTATNDSGTASVTVTTTESYCIVIDCCGSGVTTWTVGDSQTQISQTELSNATLRMSYEYKNVTGGCVMSWGGSSNDWSSCGAAFSSNPIGVSVSESVTVTDSVEDSVDSYINKDESITVTDTQEECLVSLVGVSESIALSEGIDENIRDGNDMNISVWKDTITVTDRPEFPGPRDGNISDDIGVSEKVTIKIITPSDLGYKPSFKVDY